VQQRTTDLVGVRYERAAPYAQPIQLQGNVLRVDLRPRRADGGELRSPLLLHHQDQGVALAQKRPILAVQHQIQRAPVGRGELRAAALVTQIDPLQRLQIAGLATRRPVDTAGEQRRLVQLEPVVADHLLLQIIALEGEHSPVIPVDIRPDHQLVVDIAVAAGAGIRAVVANGPADELLAILREHQVAAAVRQHIALAQLRGDCGPAIQMAPRPWPHEGKQANPDGGLGRALTLQLQQHLAA